MKHWEAEYLSMSEACKDLITTSNSLSALLKTFLTPMKLWFDNEAAITCANNKLRQMYEIRKHYVKGCETRNQVELD